VQTKLHLWSRLPERPRATPGRSTHLHSKPADPSHCKSPSEKSWQTSHPYLPYQRFRPVKNHTCPFWPLPWHYTRTWENPLVLTPAHTQALAFLNELQNKSARNTARLQHLSEKPAEEQVENLALLVTNLIESAHKVALKTCSSTSKRTTDDQQQEEELTQTVRSLPPNHHYSPRPERTKEMCEANNFTGSSKPKTSCPPPS